MTRAWLARRPTLVVLVALAMLAVMVGPAVADPSSDEARSMLRDAQERLEQLEGEFNAVVDDYNEAQEKLDQAEERVEEARAELSALQEQSDELRSSTATHVRQLHKFGPTVEVTSLLGTSDAGEAGARAAALRRVLAGQQADLQSLAAAQTAQQAAEERLRDEQAQAEAYAAEVETQRERIEATVAEQEDEVSRLETVLANAIEREEAERRAREERRRQQEAERRRQERARQQARQQERSAQQTSTQTSTQTSSQQEAPRSAPAPRANAQVAVDAALSRLGMPYRWGATGPNAFDCSGLMVWAWAQAGVSIPRTSRGQFANLTRISRSELQPGDLVFAGSPNVHHVGMYIGNGQIVHAPRSGRPVEIRSMQRSDLRGFGRVG